MQVNINGKPETVPEGATVASLLEKKGINPRLVACELNLTILKRARLAETPLHDGDTLEILQMIGGG